MTKVELTATEKDVYAILEDGKWHFRTEIQASQPFNSWHTVLCHIKNIRKKIAPSGYSIDAERLGVYKSRYRVTRNIGNPLE